MHDLNIQFKLSEEDFLNGMKLYARGTTGLWIKIFIFYVLLIFLFFFVNGLSQFTVIQVIIFIIILICFQATYYFFVIPYKAKRAYNQNRIAREDRSITFTTNNFLLKTESIESKLLWSDFKRWGKSKDIYILYITDNMFYPIPTRVIDEPKHFELFLKEKIV